MIKENIVYVTTLNLTNSTENIINKIQKEIKKQFEIARVYMAFAVKMSLRAYYLKNKYIQKIKKQRNIYLLKENVDKYEFVDSKTSQRESEVIK